MPQLGFGSKILACTLLLSISVALLASPPPKAEISVIRLDSTDGFEVIGGRAEVVTYKGRRALHLIASPERLQADDAMAAIVSASDFKDGTIEAEVAGSPIATAPGDARGFIGIMFRVQGHGTRAENFYLRPTN